MATWLEKSRSPEYSPAKLSRMLAGVEAVIGMSEVDEALAGETIIAGGYLNTHLIKANSILGKHIRAGEITADKLGVTALSAISADLGEITSGKISGTTVRGLRYLLDGNGFSLRDENNEVLITPAGILDTNNINRSDNVANGYPLIIRFYIDDQVNSIDKVFLRLTNENFRAYSTGAASGGGDTSGASSSSTTASSSETSRTSGASSSSTTASSSETSKTSGASSSSTTASGGSSTRTSSSSGSYSNTTGTRWSGSQTAIVTGINYAAGSDYPNAHVHSFILDKISHNHSFSIPNHTHTVDIQDHSHGMSHTHSFTIPGHSHGMSHTHTFTIPGHSHGMNHTHSIPNHTHDITYGIYENSATNNTVTIYVDGVQRASTSSKDASVNLSSWITTKGWHTVELRSTVLKRISAGLFIKSYIQR
jgi:hypothetical protein